MPSVSATLGITPDALASLSHAEKSCIRRRRDVKRGARNFQSLLSITHPSNLRSLADDKSPKQCDALLRHNLDDGNEDNVDSFKLPPLPAERAKQQYRSASLDRSIGDTFTHSTGQVTVFPPFFQKPYTVSGNVSKQYCIKPSEKATGANNVKENSLQTRPSLGPRESKRRNKNRTSETNLIVDSIIFQTDMANFQRDDTQMVLARIDKLLAAKPVDRPLLIQPSSLGLYNRAADTRQLDNLLKELTSVSHFQFPLLVTRNDVSSKPGEFREHLDNLPK